MRDLRIFYLETDDFWMQVVARELQRQGHSVSPYQRPEDLLKAIRRDPKPDLVIVAGPMRPMSGVQVLNEIRKDPRLNEAEVLVHTGLDTSKREIQKLGGRYIFKSDDFKNLLDAVAEIAAVESAD